MNRFYVTVWIRLVMGFLATAALLFLSAGTILYWEAWTYLAVLFTPMILFVVYMLRHDPELLRRRMKTKEKENAQKIFVAISAAVFPMVFIISGLDERFLWSDVPVALITAADAIVLAGYILFIVVMKENSYAGRTVEVESGQKVISSGVYGIIRHPMYLAAIVIFMSTPFALGSLWALYAALPIPLLLILRIRDEEKVLEKSLPGYSEYKKNVKYRLIPLIW